MTKLRIACLDGIAFFITLVFVVSYAGMENFAVAQVEGPANWTQEHFSGLKFRSIGPAIMSGRIGDVAIHPNNDNVWYVAVASGGVWKTENAGVTWKSIFDGQKSYSIGCVTIDSRNPNVIWVGTGENVGGRHIGFGDGIYRSDDGGANWKNMGLRESEHISKIVVHPQDSQTVWVASQGPLWNKGGQRGVFKTTDGGATWKQVLGDDQWTGATDLVIDPRDPHRLVAATWQRHRTVANYMGGGPKTGLHRSLDGGETWEPLTTGLPETHMGKIGLAISPQHPDTLYAAIELNRRTGAVYRSTDQGSTWEKRSDTVSGGTGPHYYQELYASPHEYDLIYLCDVRIQLSGDGGKTFSELKEENKHSDNHAMAFRASDPAYLLVGSDGGLYESFDRAENWRFIDNLPLTQFYKIALDDTEPFYNVYGGTQDNATEGGPIRTDNGHGIQNSDWKVVLDWDGHQPATEPGNPNILYAERQEGFLSRIDMSTGEVVSIQPQPDADESYERFNWDSPILVSPHLSTRIYFASQRVWMSNDRGDAWTAISGDLTRNQNRFELPIMGETKGWNNAWDVSAMSNYNTITSLSESPVNAELFYVGTDDGLIQVTENGGNQWRRVEVGELPGVPPTAFVNDIRADLFDGDTVYVALDNHKFGDYRPYLFKSTDRGRTWQSITSNLPKRLLVWRLVQDHVQKQLMFAATEFGVYFTINGGSHWTQLTGGLPTISFRDIKIHRRENDLVAASFGRGIFVLDDIGPLRELSPEQMHADATLFGCRTALWYFPRSHLGFNGGKGDQGASHFLAPNPDFGAVFTYHLKNGFESATKKREKLEKQNAKSGRPSTVPGWLDLEAERNQANPRIWLVVKDAAGNVVRRLAGPTEKGFHRVAWDLKYPTPNVVKIIPDPLPMFGVPPTGLMAAPGKYEVSLWRQQGSELVQLSASRSFDVVPLKKGALAGAEPDVVAQFWREYENSVRAHSAIQVSVAAGVAKLERMEEVLLHSQAQPGEMDIRLEALRKQFLKMDGALNGNRSKLEVGEKNNPTIQDRLFAVSLGVDRSTYGPTPTHHRTLEIANSQINEIQANLASANRELAKLVSDLVASGSPWLEGEPVKEDNR